MEIVNGTNEDTRVRVAGGGSGVAPHGKPFEDEESALSWPLLSAGGRLNHSPLPPGPWTICFVVNGRRIVTEIRSAASKVTLTPAGRAFRVQVE